jgi:hypothetical protein
MYPLTRCKRNKAPFCVIPSEDEQLNGGAFYQVSLPYISIEYQAHGRKKAEQLFPTEGK